MIKVRFIIPFIVFLLSFSQVDAQYYWVGGTGNWSDFSNHWATASGGGTFHPSGPTTSDNVFFDANSFSAGGQTVTLDVDGSTANLDFTGSTNSPTLAGAGIRTIIVANDLTFIAAMSVTFTGTISLTNSTDVTVQVGNAAKTIPNLEFPNATGDVQINTGSTNNTTDRVTFGDITLSASGVALDIEATNSNSNLKTFGTITLPANCDYAIDTPNGGSFGAANRTIVTGDFIVGNNGDGSFRGRFIEFQGDLTFGNNNECRWRNQAEFTGTTFTIGSSSGNHFQFSNDVEITNDLDIDGDVTLDFDRETDLFGDMDIASSATVNITNSTQSDSDYVIAGTTTLGNSATLIAGDGNNSPFTFDDIVCNNSVELTFNNGTESVDIANMTLGEFNVIEFNSTSSGTTFSGDLTSAGDCSNWRIVKSNNQGNQADIDFASAQSITANFMRDISVTGATFTSNSGVDDGNNSGITFSSSHTPTTLFWIGGNSGNWSDTDNWSTSSGGTAGSCIPGSADAAVFDGNSFSGSDPEFTLDLDQAFVDDIDFSAVSTAVRWEGGSSNELIVFGNFDLDSDVTNNFSGPITFTMTTAATNNLTLNGGDLTSDIEFDFSGGTWSLQDNMDINGDNADLTISNGTLNAGSNFITIENNWTVDSGGTFTAGTGTVQFDGRNSSANQEVTNGGSLFYNFVIDRQSSGNSSIVILTDAMTVSNNLTLTQGRLYDNGFQITGNATGTLTVQNGERLRLGTATVGTTFPTLFTNITLNNTSMVEYQSRVNQDVAGGFTYGRLYIQGGGNTSRTKTLQGAITVRRELRIDDFNDFLDNGFQITGTSGQTFRMDANSSFTIGTSATTTQFPTNYTVFNINANTAIIYASGQNDNQTIKDLNGGGATSYANLTLTNAGGTMRTKNLDGNIEVRGNLLIENANTLDVSASDFDVQLQGNLTWTGTGTMGFRNSALTLDGSSVQTLNFNTATANIYDLIVNNTSTGIIYSDDITIQNSLTLTDGIMTPQASEIITFNDGATVSSASNESFVDGIVEKIGNEAFTFPVGDGSAYREVSISAPANATDVFQAQYFATSPEPSFPRAQKDAALTLVSALEYWTLDISNGTPTVDVTLSWDSNSGVGDPTDLRIAHWDTGGTNWDNYGNDATTGDATAGTITVNSVSTFSPFTFGTTSIDNTLPVEWLYFKAHNQGNDVMLEWATSVEINNDYFSIQKSANGNNWISIGQIEGAGNSNSTIEYEFRDLISTERAYYRIMQTDFDGSFKISEIRHISLQNVEVSIYPNPVSDYLRIRSVSSFEKIQVVDSRGVEVIDSIQNVSNYDLDLTGLTSGIYYLILKSGNQQIKRKIIK